MPIKKLEEQFLHARNACLQPGPRSRLHEIQQPCLCSWFREAPPIITTFRVMNRLCSNSFQTTNLMSYNHSLFHPSTLMTPLVRWAVFSVLLALLPLVMGLIRPLFSQDISIDWNSLVTKGQILLVTVGLCGTALGEIIGAATRDREIHLLCAAGGATLVIIGATLVFGDIAVVNATEGAKVTQFAHYTAWFIFAMGILTAGSCIHLSGRGK